MGKKKTLEDIGFLEHLEYSNKEESIALNALGDIFVPLGL
jgi:hypothetical protein